VNLHLVAPAVGVGNFVMNVVAEGIVVLNNFDVNSAAGGTFQAHIETFSVNVSDGTLDLDFVRVSKGALVCAIEVVPNLPGPNIQVSTLSLDFGQVVINATSDLTVTVTNTGNAVLNVSELNITNTVFSLVNPPVLPFPVAANGGTQVLTVRFSPTAASMESGNLEIVSDDPDEPSINVSLDGEGINQPPPQEFRINSGGPTYTAINSNVFSADQAYTSGSFGFVGGRTFNFANAIGGTNDDPLYQDVRFNTESPFSYRFDVSISGNYDVSLHLMAPALGVGNFIMDVSAEGAVILDDFDINATAGGTFLALIETFTVNVSDGTLDLDFVTVNKAAIVCAIEVVEQSNGPSLTKETPLPEPIVSNIPKEFHLFQNHPNPFNPTTRINYAIPEDMHVTLTIHNLLGQAVRTLVNTYQGANSYQAQWDARNESGIRVPSGIYIYRLRGSAGLVEAKKMILLK